MNVISLAPLASADIDPVEQVKAAAGAGFDAMGLRLTPARPEHDLVADVPQRREVIAALRDTGIRLLETGNIRLHPGDDVRKFLPVLEVGHELGAEHLLVTGTDAPERLDAFPNFAALCELAQGAGMRPMIEFVSYRSIASLEQAKSIIDNAGNPGAGICVDPLHLSRSGSGPSALRALDPRLFPYAHFCDARSREAADRSQKALHAESVADRLFPGEGALWLDEFLDALPAGLPLNVEAPHKSHANETPLARARAALAATRHFLEDYYATRRPPRVVP